MTKQQAGWEKYILYLLIGGTIIVLIFWLAELTGINLMFFFGGLYIGERIGKKLKI